LLKLANTTFTSKIVFYKLKEEELKREDKRRTIVLKLENVNFG